MEKLEYVIILFHEKEKVYNKLIQIIINFLKSISSSIPLNVVSLKFASFLISEFRSKAKFNLKIIKSLID
jgi:hypothetical protein